MPNHTQDEERSVPQSLTHPSTGYLARRLPNHFLEAASSAPAPSLALCFPPAWESLPGVVKFYSVAQSGRGVRSHTSQASGVLHQRDTVLKNSAIDNLLATEQVPGEGLTPWASCACAGPSLFSAQGHRLNYAWRLAAGRWYLEVASTLAVPHLQSGTW